MVIALRLHWCMYNDLLCAVGCKMCVLLSLLDLLAAFDTINHTVLLQRFEHAMGITGSALEWLKSYFSGREQFVHVEGASSCTYVSGICDWSVQIPHLSDTPGEDLHCS